MCFSANANFIASAGIAAVGIATLRHVDHPRAVLFGTVPLLFALHQLTEGFVWLGVDKDIRPEALGHMTFLFILYAQGILPFLMPLAVLLLEKRGWRFNAILTLTLLGAGLCVYVLYALIALPSDVGVQHHSLSYRNPGTENAAVAILYVVATTGALVLSSHKVVSWFGLLNVIGVVGTLLVAVTRSRRSGAPTQRSSASLSIGNSVAVALTSSDQTVGLQPPSRSDFKFKRTVPQHVAFLWRVEPPTTSPCFCTTPRTMTATSRCVRIANRQREETRAFDRRWRRGFAQDRIVLD